MSHQPKVSILIPNYNGKHFLKTCLPSIFKNAYKNFEIIVIDNNSNDGSVQFLQNSFPQVKLVINQSNLGYSGAMNKGTEKATGDYYLFLDSDTKVDESWLKELLKIITSDKNIGLCASQIIDKSDNHTSYVRGGIIDKNGFFAPQCSSLLDRNKETREIHFGITSWIVSKEAFYKANKFDPNYKFFCDDTDLSWRIRLCGYRNLYVPKSIVHHFKIKKDSAKESLKNLYRKRYIFEKDYLTTLLKNLEPRTLKKTLPLYLLKKIMISPLDLVALDFTAPAGLWGIISAFRNSKEQRRLFQNRKIADKDLLKNNHLRLSSYKLRTSPKTLSNPFK